MIASESRGFGLPRLMSWLWIEVKIVFRHRCPLERKSIARYERQIRALSGQKQKREIKLIRSRFRTVKRVPIHEDRITDTEHSLTSAQYPEKKWHSHLVSFRCLSPIQEEMYLIQKSCAHWSQITDIIRKERVSSRMERVLRYVSTHPCIRGTDGGQMPRRCMQPRLRLARRSKRRIVTTHRPRSDTAIVEM
jgi:hypothetical protein